jgi:hypothetical protein
MRRRVYCLAVRESLSPVGSLLSFSATLTKNLSNDCCFWENRLNCEYVTLSRQTSTTRIAKHRSFIKLNFLQNFWSSCKTLADQVARNPRFYCIMKTPLPSMIYASDRLSDLGRLEMKISRYFGKRYRCRLQSEWIWQPLHRSGSRKGVRVGEPFGYGSAEEINNTEDSLWSRKEATNREIHFLGLCPCAIGKWFPGLRFYCPKDSWIIESLTNLSRIPQTWEHKLSPDSFLLNMIIVIFVETSRNLHSLTQPNPQSRFSTMTISRWSPRTDFVWLLTFSFPEGPKGNRKKCQSR